MRKAAYTDAHLIVDVAWPTKLRRPLLATPEIKASVKPACMRLPARTTPEDIRHHP